MTERVVLRAFAKVNYALEVRGLRDDGYHDISSVLQSVSLADELEIERSQGGFELTFEPDGVEIGPLEENTVYKAWALLWEASGRELPARIRLHKKIPAGAGLGGGSADAAAVLVGMNELFDLGLETGDLRRLGARIGADVPFCVSGGTALGEGVGDVLTPLPAPPGHHLLLAKPDRSADTGGIYRAYDRRGARSVASVEPVIAALRSGSLEAFAGVVGNDLEPVSADLVPEVAAYKREMLQAGALGAAMTGTGTAVYGIFDAEEAAAGCQLRAPFLGTCEPVEAGVEMI
ncbi:MAG TPA: 4-(cytidine 5'-diphospho)-2-C-methyl-D-erythritol kinase [Rubrobacteraceae bacterium]|nr:4-(cytidine 5'-diphospho)-2-C-methyl-D-erythritol kinase [Rubrobacteraceae bacterium]